MRIALNALQLQPGKMGGVEVYFRNLVKALAQVEGDNDYVILTNPGVEHRLTLNRRNYLEINLDLAPTGRLLLLRRAKHKLLQLVRPSPYPISFQDSWLSNKIQQQNIDLIHHPFSVLYPLNNVPPGVLTFWDMQHETYPEFFEESTINWRQKKYRPSAEMASHIIVGSNYTRQTLVAEYGVPPGKITTIYFGAGPEFYRPISPTQIANLRARYKLADSVIFYPAATYPHKNHLTLLLAFKLLCKKSSQNIQLVLTGAEMWYEMKIQAAIKELGLQKSVRRLGYVPATELPIFYAAASMVVFPSLYEGYGIPVIEAMAAARPVVCSNICSLPELAGNAAIVIDPLDETAWASAMFEVLMSRNLSEQLAKRAQLRSMEFSWVKAAQKTLDVYENVADSKN
jgi:glycosyltransferase involved in cell wall biosynthesis